MAAQNLVDHELHSLHLSWEYILAQAVQLIEAPGIGQRLLPPGAAVGPSARRGQAQGVPHVSPEDREGRAEPGEGCSSSLYPARAPPPIIPLPRPRILHMVRR